MAAVSVALVVKGSQGQVRVNPVADYVAKLDTRRNGTDSPPVGTAALLNE
jgi:hypothetical protein